MTRTYRGVKRHTVYNLVTLLSLYVNTLERGNIPKKNLELQNTKHLMLQMISFATT